MTLSQLIDTVEEMKKLAQRFDADPEKVNVKMFGENGIIRRSEVRGLVSGVSVSMDTPIWRDAAGEVYR